MKQYPSIEYWNKGIFGENIYAFDKLDGSNIRAEWSRKLSKKTSFTNGFNKFGTRRQMIDGKNDLWGWAVDLFMDKYSSELDKIFREDKQFRNARNMTVFFEYFGDQSFAGRHFDKLQDMNVVLFDVSQFQKGLIIPKTFVEKFGHLDIPKIIYQGNYNKQLIADVRNNVYGLTEGVVIKGSRKTKGDELVWMVKIKTIEWLNKVKNTLGQEELKTELNGDLSLL